MREPFCQCDEIVRKDLMEEVGYIDATESKKVKGSSPQQLMQINLLFLEGNTSSLIYISFFILLLTPPSYLPLDALL